MSYLNHTVFCCVMLACGLLFLIHPVHAFTANSLDIVVDKNGDATATFRFTLEGIIENAIPQSVLEEQLQKGLSAGTEPPELVSMDRSTAVLLLKKFADISDVDTGTEYRTESMDFKKAEVALQNSGLSGAVTADFTPDSVTVTFPDSFRKSFTNADSLPSVTHIVIDPSKTPKPTAVPVGGTGSIIPPAAGLTGSMAVNSTPEGVKVYVDSQYLGEASSIFSGIAPGTHIVDFRKDNYESASKNVTVFAGKTTHVMVVLKFSASGTSEDTSSFPLVPFVVVVIGLLVIAAGGYFWWSEKEKTRGGGNGGPGPKSAGNGGPVEKRTGPVTEEVKKSLVIRDISETPSALSAPAAPAEPAAAPAAPAAPIEPVERPPLPAEPPSRNPPAGHPVVRTTQLADIPGMPLLPKETVQKKSVRKSTVVRVSPLRDIPEENPSTNGSDDTKE